MKNKFLTLGLVLISVNTFANCPTLENGEYICQTNGSQEIVQVAQSEVNGAQEYKIDDLVFITDGVPRPVSSQGFDLGNISAVCVNNTVEVSFLDLDEGSAKIVASKTAKGYKIDSVFSLPGEGDFTETMSDCEKK